MFSLVWETGQIHAYVLILINNEILTQQKNFNINQSEYSKTKHTCSKCSGPVKYSQIQVLYMRYLPVRTPPVVFTFRNRMQ
jgi:hypothetical protein